MKSRRYKSEAFKKNSLGRSSVLQFLRSWRTLYLPHTPPIIIGPGEAKMNQDYKEALKKESRPKSEHESE